MIDNNKENEILQLALETLRKNIDLPVEIKTEAIEQPTYLDLKADRLLRIVVQGTELHFYVEVKANITNIALANVVIYKIKEVHLPYKVLLITRYVTPQLAGKLKQENIQFIDTAGNAYINHPPLYLFVKGNKLPDTFRRVPLKRIFKPTGLKLTYAFLCNPGLENRPYREIAAVADVALGTVGWVMRDLKETGYLLDMGKKGKQLIERENLLNRWITAYPEQLKPKLLLGRFRGAPDWWRDKTLEPDKAQWGGEIAAAKLTQYLKPEVVTIYTTHEQLTPLLIENRLRKDPNGDTEILERFWKQEKPWRYEDNVHPILIYADLLATGNQRNIETAKMIYEQYIVRLIREKY